MQIIDKKEYLDLKNAIKIHNKLGECFNDITNYYIRIGGYLEHIYVNKIYDLMGYKTIYEYAEECFKLSKTTTNNFINLFKKFGTSTEYWEDYCLKEEYEDYSYSQLVELLSVDEDKVLSYSPELSVREIRNVKKLEKYENILVEELKKILLMFMSEQDKFKKICTIDFTDLVSKIVVSSEKVYLTIPFVISSGDVSINSSFKIIVEYSDDGDIIKQLSSSLYESHSYSDVPDLSFDNVNLNKISLSDAIDNFVIIVSDYIEKYNNSEDRKNFLLLKEEKERLKEEKYYSVQSLIDNNLYDNVSKSLINFFNLLKLSDVQMIKKNNPFSANSVLYFYFNRIWFIKYKEYELNVDYCSIRIIKNNKSAYLSFSKFIELLIQYNCSFNGDFIECCFSETFPTSELEK